MPITHMGYFKPPSDAFPIELRSKDLRSAKEWEYTNAIGVWTELGLMSLEVARTHDGTTEDLTRKLALTEEAFKAVLEITSMRAPYFTEITEQVVEIARKMSFHVKQGHDAVFSESYRSARTALIAKMETVAAKMLAKSRVERASSRSRPGDPQGAAQSE